MTIHLAKSETETNTPKCGARSWGSFSSSLGLYISPDATQVDCKRCTGTAKRPGQNASIQENYVGRIFHCSWGYSMTINEFAVCVRQTEKALFLRQCASATLTGDTFGGHQTSDGKPLENAPEFKVRKIGDSHFKGSLIQNRHGDSYKNKSAKYWSLWDGRPVYYNHCD